MDDAKRGGKPKIGILEVSADGKCMHLNGENGVSLVVKIGCSLEETFGHHSLSGDTLRIYYCKGTELQIKLSSVSECIERYKIKWSNPNHIHYMKDIVDTASGGFWYGGPQLAQQKWPIAKQSYAFAPYVSGDVLKTFEECGDPLSGMERYWLCSNKFAFHVADEVPLWAEHMDGRLSLQAQIRDSPYLTFYESCDDPVLEYSIYAMKPHKSLSLKSFHMAVHRTFVKKLPTAPDMLLIERPIWTTWARYKTAINQDLVLEFASEIKRNNAEISQLELDDDWATKYGDFEFNAAKFPNVPELCEELQRDGIRLTLWVHPFINLDSENAQKKSVLELCVKTDAGSPGITKWWHDSAYVIDFTNPKAAHWFSEQLRSLQKLGVFSFKFDGGEVTYLPPRFRLHAGKSPNDYVKAYIEMASQFGNAIEARVFSRCQELPVFFRTLDRESTWEHTGLDSILPVALNFSLLGYSFNMPDMIGGNGYSLGTCSKELFIRWMQANLFLLTMQFSYTPWDYDTDTCAIFHHLMKTRKEMYAYLTEAVKKCCETGEPAVCPMWWISDSKEALACGDQFVINDKLVVAPVMKEGQIKRSVFLPAGVWKHAATQSIYDGPKTIEVDAPLAECVPYFIRQ